MELREEIERLDAKRRKGILFIIFFSFLITFIVARSFVILTDEKIHLIIEGYTIHHAIYGLIILALVGGIAILYKGYEKILAIFYGIGLGLTADEFGFLISFGNYWNRLSYDVFLILTLIFLNVIFFEEFWRKVGKKLYRKIKKKGHALS